MPGMKGERRKKSSDPARVEELKKKINNEEYLKFAVQRLATVISDQMCFQDGGAFDERQWQRN
ncbi:hypothetical protein FACS1894102_2920 [Spirochaetia bacterium]|nr:hypothetical protein FACS1894102_2920 [Spirochaetia bacterium]